MIAKPQPHQLALGCKLPPNHHQERTAQRVLSGSDIFRGRGRPVQQERMDGILNITIR